MPIRTKVNECPRYNPPCPKCRSTNAKKGYTKLVCFDCGYTCKILDALRIAQKRGVKIRRQVGFTKKKRLEPPKKSGKEPVILKNWGVKDVGF